MRLAWAGVLLTWAVLVGLDAVIGGMLTGTLLTLFFAPLFFLLVQQGMMRLKRRKP